MKWHGKPGFHPISLKFALILVIVDSFLVPALQTFIRIYLFTYCINEEFIEFLIRENNPTTNISGTDLHL